MGILNPCYLKRRARKWWPYIVVLVFLIIGYYKGLFSQLSSYSSDSYEEEPRAILKEVKLMRSVIKRYSIPETEYSDVLLPTIYVISPTYARPHQKAELTRLKNVFLHIPALHWILVEDASHKSQLVSDFLKLSDITFTHLHHSTPDDWKLKDKDPNWRKPRGVLQRNAGIKWLREKFLYDSNPRGVVYFADDDNTYSIELFKEMRETQTVSVWPVGLVGGVMVERPQVSIDDQTKSHVTGWLTGWKPNRPFATDMAGFAVNLSFLLKKSKAEFSLTSKIGYLESDFLEKLITMDQLEPKAKLCTKVYVWHTRTEKPNMKDEERLRNAGKPTDEGIEV
ncbi:galactosylgalactosylxylosylprotein 3-beta-glucuronosyltransferase 3-like isoform X2 [Homarus americanus]|uniref:galactosylgalactosylxylosylprotein 3-beta-glucuronosyltransferase 3-like isoform X2 n=1 Tax=Homarus americanus TaxID=6706 RepID=UPI001C47CBC4|nr:galactosylgalactosylxylosylprotein 3-beta-glucuronosyltransferase 3-like isoform X2 [Homarus americanus]